ncbi:hypothetical protein [Methanosarcina sp. UBA289]|uniref:hypothetical protein n=1 Tax=Methanosarcina sp. UBA289 TaxID=1915574 RepID=UPI0025EAEC43|nr:hypothetical protein [Methanosarcina sp. UBA289]
MNDDLAGIIESCPLQQQILCFIESVGFATSTDLSKTFGKGEYTLSDPEQRNVLHAFGLSESVCIALNALIEMRELIPVPCMSILFEHFSGNIPDLPLSWDLSESDTQTKCWLPVIFVTVGEFKKFADKVFSDKTEAEAIITEITSEQQNCNINKAYSECILKVHSSDIVVLQVPYEHFDEASNRLKLGGVNYSIHKGCVRFGKRELFVVKNTDVPIIAKLFISGRLNENCMYA